MIGGLRLLVRQYFVRGTSAHSIRAWRGKWLPLLSRPFSGCPSVVEGEIYGGALTLDIGTYTGMCSRQRGT